MKLRTGRRATMAHREVGCEIEGLRRRWLDEIKNRFPWRWEKKWRDGSG